jgi:hypothetical protein
MVYSSPNIGTCATPEHILSQRERDATSNCYCAPQASSWTRLWTRPRRHTEYSSAPWLDNCGRALPAPPLAPSCGRSRPRHRTYLQERRETRHEHTIQRRHHRRRCRRRTQAQTHTELQALLDAVHRRQHAIVENGGQHAGRGCSHRVVPRSVGAETFFRDLVHAEVCGMRRDARHEHRRRATPHAEEAAGLQQPHERRRACWFARHLAVGLR